MAYEVQGFTYTFPASTGLRQYQFVDINSNGRLIHPTTSGKAIGVLCSSGTTGSTGRAGSTDSGSVQEVQLYGIAKVLAGTTGIAIGGVVTPATDGRGSTRVAGDYQAGIALAAVGSTSTSAQVIPVLLLHAGATGAF